MAKPDRVQECLEFYRASQARSEKQRKREKDDLKCQVPSEMWNEDVISSRKGGTVKGVAATARPVISLDVLTEPVQLVTGAQRSAHLGIKIHPLTPDADEDTAEMLQDLYRNIEVDSRASFARDWAFDRSTKCGLGWYQILSVPDFSTGVPGDQKLVIRRFLDQSQVYPDWNAIEPDFSDGERALVIEDVPWRTYARKYKASKLADYTDEGLNEIGTDDQCKDWIGGDGPDSRTVRLGLLYYVEYEGEQRIVRACLVNAIEELDSFTWGGRYIPLVPTIGNELQPFDGERRWSGMYTNAKEAARLTMWGASGAVEIASMEPLAPWQADPRVIDGYEEEYRQSNTRRIPVLHYNAEVDGRPMEKPSRVQIDVSRLGPNLELMHMGEQFVRSATATRGPALGEQTPAHRSGRAIVALQDQTVAATNGYQANYKDITLMCESRVILDAIPTYYDRPGRIVTLRDSEDRTRQAIVNQPHVMDEQTNRPVPIPYGTPEEQRIADARVANQQDPALHFALSKGRYGVAVSVGRDTSKTEEAQKIIGDTMQAIPELGLAIAPLFLKYQDGPGTEEMAKLATRQRDHLMPWLSDDPAQQDSARLAAENAALKQQLEAAAKAIETKQIEQMGKLEATKVQEASAQEIARMNNEVKLAVAEITAQSKLMQDSMRLFAEERARLGTQQHETGMALMDHAAAGQQADRDGAQQAALAGQEHGQALEQNAQQAALTPPSPNGSGA